MLKNLYITLICDYGQNDLAFIECYNEFMYEFSKIFNNNIYITTISTKAFNTTENGFIVGQIANNSKLIKSGIHLVFHNCAPRKDNKEKRKNNDGEGLGCSILKNGVIVIGVNSGNSFSFIKEDVYNLKCETKGSQFRSRDIFPNYIAKIFAEYFISKNNSFEDILKNHISTKQDKPLIKQDTVVYIDGYGNIKNNINLEQFEDGSYVEIEINKIKRKAIVSKDGIFSVNDGDLVLSYGSSGWNDFRFSEIVLRGGSASILFEKPNTEDEIKVVNIDK
jgi:hypothetical protein